MSEQVRNSNWGTFDASKTVEEFRAIKGYGQVLIGVSYNKRTGEAIGWCLAGVNIHPVTGDLVVRDAAKISKSLTADIPLHEDNINEVADAIYGYDVVPLISPENRRFWCVCAPYSEVGIGNQELNTPEDEVEVAAPAPAPAPAPRATTAPRANRANRANRAR